MGLGLFAVAFVGSAVGLWLVSQITEALRPVPQTPETLRWAPDIPIGYLDVGGCKLRYIRAGRGPNLVLLHTLRTQLDLFEKVVPELARRFTVYALDYPGHGYSDIPEAQYDAEFFAESVAKFLDVLDLHDVTLSGVSIGGAIALILAGRRNPRVERDLISERTKEGLAAARAQGRLLGRPKGSLGSSKLDGKEGEIRMLLEKEVSKASIAKIVGVSSTNLRHFIRTRKLDLKVPGIQVRGRRP